MTTILEIADTLPREDDRQTPRPLDLTGPSTMRETAAQLAKANDYNPNLICELAACLMEEINYHKQAYEIRNA